MLKNLDRLLAAMALVGAAACSSSPTLVYKDPTRSIDDRVTDLLGRMTLKEKFWQLFMVVDDGTGSHQKYQNGAFGLQLRLSPDSSTSPRQTALRINALQHFFVDSTRLGIPIIPFEEALHGLVLDGATVFPQAIGLAATWDTALMGKVAQAIAGETRARGFRQVLSPVLNIATDVRWGRVEETYGEDPFLVSRMGVAFVRPFEDSGIVTTPKHFVANVGEGGRDSYPIDLSQRALMELHFPPFKAAIQEGHARSVMAAYNSVDGVPASANHWLLGTTLKEQWGFRGFVISDAGGTGGAVTQHFTAPDYATSGKLALEAGLDVIFQTSASHDTLFWPAFESGAIDQRVIDNAVRRVLRAKFELGLFEHPYVAADSAEQPGTLPEHRKLALEAAREAVTLLRNDTRLLPLKKSLHRVTVIGTDASEARLGGYSGPGREKISILDGIRSKLPAAVVSYEAGPGRDSSGEWESAIARATAAAGTSEVTIVVAGINEGEFHDRSSLKLPGHQEELIRSVAATGKPVVVVLVGGSAITMGNWIDQVGAVLLAWYPGERGGDAVADVLFGDYNPAGRLPISFPRSEGQLPLSYYHKPTGRGDDYADLPGSPAFPFGYGMSYTSFEYSGISVNPAEIAPRDSAVVTFRIRNSGSVAGDEVAQLYIRDELASVAQPVIKLAGFRRVHLEPGEEKPVSMVLSRDQLALLNEQLQWVVEPGRFRVMVGSSVVDVRLRGVLTVQP